MRLKAMHDGDRQMVSILECVGLDGLPAVEAACQEALDQGVFSAAVIINILARKRDPQCGRHPFHSRCASPDPRASGRLRPLRQPQEGKLIWNDPKSST